MKPLLKIQSKMTDTWGHFKKLRIKIYFVCAHLSFRISVFFPKPYYNNSNNKTIKVVAGHNTPIIKFNVIVGKIPHKAVIKISNNFSYETSMAAQQGSLQCNYICSLAAVESLLSIVIIFFKRWRVVFQSLHNLAALSVPRNNSVGLAWNLKKAIVKLNNGLLSNSIKGVGDLPVGGRIFL